MEWLFSNLFLALQLVMEIVMWMIEYRMIYC
jgi:hypothetical protein